jgi:hypothetical protein
VEVASYLGEEKAALDRGHGRGGGVGAFAELAAGLHPLQAGAELGPQRSSPTAIAARASAFCSASWPAREPTGSRLACLAVDLELDE